MNDNTVSAARQTLTEDVLGKVVRYARLPLCITDPTLPDNPIVYVNDAFTDLTGYLPLPARPGNHARKRRCGARNPTGAPGRHG